MKMRKETRERALNSIILKFCQIIFDFVCQIFDNQYADQLQLLRVPASNTVTQVRAHSAFSVQNAAVAQVSNRIQEQPQCQARHQRASV